MDIGTNYTFAGLVRYGYGWSNPNHAAAVIGLALPFCCTAEWVARRKGLGRPWIYGSKAIETIMLVILVLTYSRTGALGWVAGMCFFWVFAGSTSKKNARWKFAAQAICGRILTLFCIMFGTQMHQRVFDVFKGDASFSNRLSLWKGGIALIYASPLSGWGLGRSGAAYMDWMQYGTSDLAYQNLVNSYLDFIVQFGLPAFAIVFTALICPVILSCRCEKPESVTRQALLLGSAASILSFGVCSLGSNLWSEITILCFVSAVMIILCYILAEVCTMRVIITSLKLSSIVSICICLILFVGSATAVFAGKRYVVRSWDGDVRQVVRGALVDDIEVAVVADYSALGLYVEREIREAVSGLPHIKSLRIFRHPNDYKFQKIDLLVLIGEDNHWLERVPSPAVWIGPTCSPPIDVPHNLLSVSLPEYDETGGNTMWINWSRQHRIAVYQIKGCGSDLRSSLREQIDLALQYRDSK